MYLLINFETKEYIFSKEKGNYAENANFWGSTSIMKQMVNGTPIRRASCVPRSEHLTPQLL